MKVIKRDGHTVDYDKEKIITAIGKANEELPKEERATDTQIKNIVKYIESLNKKRILVEDIQDIIEVELMKAKKYELAKHYIVYRYNRALIRKSNTTDESILSLIRRDNRDLNGDRNSSLACTQRNYIASEVSKDLTKRVLLPERITKAHEDGIIFFHDMDYFVQPLFNSALINLEDMLDNGTVINGKMIESPKGFNVACIVTSQIIASLIVNQYGGLSIDTSCLAKYLRKSRDKYVKRFKKILKTEDVSDYINDLVDIEVKKELADGIQMLQYQLNTLMTLSGHIPFITMFLYIKPKDTYAKENAMIIEEILKQRETGMKGANGEYITPGFPKLVYVLDECNNLSGGKYDYLTELAIKCSQKRIFPDYISAKIMRNNYEGNVFSPMGSRSFLSLYREDDYKFLGRFNQGVVSLNLPQIGIIADGDEFEFWKLLDERLDLCKEALLCRHHALQGLTSDVSPLHWQYGAIARLESGEKIDKYLLNGYSTLSLGYIGINELTKSIVGTSHITEAGFTFAKKVLSYMKNKCVEWSKETGVEFVLYGTPPESINDYFVNHDLEQFGRIKDVNDKGYYTDSYHIDSNENVSSEEKIKIEYELQNLSLGGSISSIKVSDKSNDTVMRETIKYIYDNIQYAEIN